jgi:hypothetical protein
VPVLQALIGVAVVGWVLNDVFTTVILPRPAPARYRPAGLLTRWTWRIWRRYADASRSPELREQRLGIFAPAIVMILLGVWIVLQAVTGGLSLVHPEAGGGVAFFAHIGGFAFGLATGLLLLLLTRRRPRMPPRGRPAW